jgi:glycosyltransferase involved in cell wall biosynthesis
MKLCFLSVMPSPYMEDLFESLNAASDLEIQVLYETMAVQDTHWGDRRLPEYAMLIGSSSSTPPIRRFTYNSGITTDLLQADADLYIVQGYSSLTDQAAFRWLIKQQKRWGFWGERPGLRKRGWLGRMLRERAMRPVLESADGIVGIGKLAVEKYQERLTRDIPVVNIPYLCRLDHFMEAADQQQGLESSQPETPITILYCGQLIHRKGLDTLLLAFQSLRSKYNHIKLRLVGSGPDEEKLKSMLSETERPSVEFTGFQSVDALPGLFASSDIFVLPSRHDGWGVVVNQALAAGLPIICSDQVGAGFDLIEQGRNGFQFPVEDWEALARSLQELIGNPDLRQQMSQASRTAANNWTPERGAELWRDFATTLLQSSHEKTVSAS